LSDEEEDEDGFEFDDAIKETKVIEAKANLDGIKMR